MKNKKNYFELLGLSLLAVLAACGSDAATPTRVLVENTAAATTSNTPVVQTTAIPSETNIPAATLEPAQTNTEDVTWNEADVVAIELQGDTATVTGEGVTVDNSRIEIAQAGTYRLTGTLDDGQVVVNTEDEGIVRLLLNGVELHNSTNAPLYIQQAEQAVIVLEDGSQNILTDAAEYVQTSDNDEPNAALFSEADVTIAGNGALEVTGNYNDGIGVEDGLVITGGVITVNAADDGIRGKDYLVVENGQVNVTAGGDALKADNDEDASRGYVTIQDGTFQITSGGDGVTAETNILIENGDFTITSAGGSGAQIDEDLSAKGIKAGQGVTIQDGTFIIDAADDTVHSNNTIEINGGALTLSTGDDAIHADNAIVINEGDINITESNEGIESFFITFNDGNISVVSSDDAINGAEPDNTTATGTILVQINGGYIVLDAGGDGLDSNGAVEMTGGVVIINGPAARGNAAVDYDGGFKMTGGFLIGVGSARMAETPDQSSTQAALLLNLTAPQPAGTLIQIRNAENRPILTFLPIRGFDSIAFSSPEFMIGETYTVYLGGSVEGESKDELYSEATPSTGTEYTEFTVTDIVTGIGQIGRR